MAYVNVVMFCVGGFCYYHVNNALYFYIMWQEISTFIMCKKSIFHQIS